MAQTLEELKAANAAAEQVEVEKPETKVVENKIINNVDDEAWLQTDEQESDDDDDGGDAAKFTDSDVANVRRKLKGRLKDEQEKSKTLEQEVAELKAQLNRTAAPVRQRPVTPRVPQSRMPKLSDFGYNEDRYNAALATWVKQQSIAANQEASQKAQQNAEIQEAKRRSQEAVDSHYLRADKLTREHNIDPEVYGRADNAVRRAVDSVIAGGGDTITEALIERLGEGSEKVLYNLGRNKAKLEEFANRLRQDRSGVSASIYLGQLKSEVVGSGNRGSNAPSPSRQLTGDGGSGGESAGSLKRKYLRAGDDIQKRIDIKRQAKRSGIDVSGW